MADVGPIEAMAKALPGVTERDRRARRDVTREEFETLQQQLVATQRSLIRAHEKLIELEADLAVAGIGKGAAKHSGLILPDHVKPN